VGKRGPKPQPTALKELRGNPGKRALPPREPKPKGKLPACPKHLEGEARKAWQAFAKQLTDSGIATALDATALEMLCASYALYVEAMQQVLAFGPVWMEKGASKIPKFVYSPHWAVKNREWKNVLSILREFGMTPSSRSGVQAVPSESANPFAALMRPALN
jgi:P27 family predicted phage terminase small subunit